MNYLKQFHRCKRQIKKAVASDLSKIHKALGEGAVVSLPKLDEHAEKMRRKRRKEYIKRRVKGG